MEAAAHGDENQLMTHSTGATGHNGTFVIGDAVFSSWAGTTLSGRGALFGRHHDLAEMRNIPKGDALPQGSVVYFCRNATVDTEPGRFIGAFRVAADQKNRPSLHGYGALIIGQDLDAFEGALDALTAYDDIDETGYAHIVSATDFFDAQNAADNYRPLVKLFKSGKQTSFALEPSHERLETWRTLWVLSYTMTGVRDIYASTSLADTGADPLPTRPPMPKPRPPAPKPGPVKSRKAATPNATVNAEALRQNSGPSSREQAETSLLDQLLMPLDTRDPDLLAERLGIAHQTIHELVNLNEEHERRIAELEVAFRRGSGTGHSQRRTKANVGALGTSGGLGGRSLMTEVEPRSIWPKIAIATTLLILLVSLIAFLFLRVF
ncbi:hypothetical protein [Roseovarius sp.]|uniref:hypothetical protein n=1 Tax=Roseovarius sp. TaxID=1486281 RepID=UPI00356AAEF7